MATFPAALEPSPESSIIPDAGIKPYVTEGGGVRGRIQYAEAVINLTLVYPDLTDAEVTLIDDHFALGLGPHQVDARGVTYDVVYTAQPLTIEYHGNLRTIQVSFLGTVN